MINLRESIGVAVNTGSLALDEEHERAVDRVASLGFTDELGSMLWRLKYGEQRHYHELLSGNGAASTLMRIALRLEHWLRRREQRWPVKKRGELFPLFVRLALAHWLCDKCTACHGRGMLGVERTTLKSVRLRCPQCAGRGYSHRITARGAVLERICGRCCGNRSVVVLREIEAGKPRPCPACDGLGVAVLTATMWAALLGISAEEWSRHWEKPMLRLQTYLAAVDKRTHGQVKNQLGRD